MRVGLALFLMMFVMTGCSNKNPHYDPSKSHHREDGFANRYSGRAKKEGFWKWQWERRVEDLPKPPVSPIKPIEPDLSFIQNNRIQTAATWVGHATVLLQTAGLNILTDPQWSERASPVSFAGPTRHQKPGVPFDQLPPIDVVLISHNHYDHLDLQTVRDLMAKHPGVRFYVPLGVDTWFERNVEGTQVKGESANVIAMDWEDKSVIQGAKGEVELQFHAVQHWSARTPWDRYETLWGGWAVLHPEFRFWFSGDLGYSKDTQDVGRRLGSVDLAAIAIGAYEPRWFMQQMHINPAEAVKVMQEVGAKHALAVHWGTFERLTDESLDEPPRALKKVLDSMPEPRPDFRVLAHGQTWKFD